ncbi:hypothetical protein ACJ41O_010149 [Fusarium nematophilum]
MPPFGPVPQSNEAGRRLDSAESYGPHPLNGQSAFAGKDQDDEIHWHIPTPVSKDNSTWDPFKGTDLAKDDVSEHSGVLLANPNQGHATEVPSSKPLPGDATPTASNAQIRMVPPEPPSPSQHPSSAYASVTSQEPTSQEPTSGGMPQSRNEAAIPQRQSSFVGLPLIRRGSTFDVTSKPTEPIDERVSLEAEPDVDEAATRQQGTLTSEVTVGSTLVGTDSLVPGKDVDEKGTEESQKHAPSSASTDHQLPAQQRQHPAPQAPQQMQQQQDPFQMHPVQQGRLPQQHPPFGPAHMVPPNMAGNPIQRLPPSGPWKLEESHLSEPLHRVTPKPQQLPPSGAWKLEESHLAEPLHSVNRNRAGTGSSQQEPSFGYDKETGVSLPAPSSSANQQYQQRQKPPEVPPSSANRYPGLFPSQQQPESNAQAGGPAPSQQRRLSHEGGSGILRAMTGGAETAHEDRGRSRKASSLFKDIGSRFRKGSSERRGTSAEPKAQPAEQQQQQQPLPDAASESSITTEEIQERKKARASFLLGLRNRPSTDHGRQPSRDGAMGPPRPDEARPETSSEERKLSRFGTGLGVTTGQHRPSGPARASTSLAHESGPTGPAMSPPKKRFSGFNTKATGAFHRSSTDVTVKPGTPISLRPASGQQPLQQPAALDRPNMSHPGFERSNTAGPTYGQMQPAPVGAPLADAPERRKRRGSAAGLISGLLGHSGKNKDQSQSVPAGPPPGQQPPMQQPQARYPSGPQPGVSQVPGLQTQGQPQGHRPSGSQLPTPQFPGRQLGCKSLWTAACQPPASETSELWKPTASNATSYDWKLFALRLSDTHFA